MKSFASAAVCLFVTLASARASVQSDLMYPVREEDNLNLASSLSQVTKDLDFDLSFYGYTYNFTRVSLHGYLEFTDSSAYYEKYPLVFPRNYPYEKDPAFIGPFFSKMRIGSSESTDGLQNGVYFRQESKLSSRNDKTALELKERVKKDIQSGDIMGAKNFEPENIVVVTWKGLSFAGGIQDSLKITNTFQVILATNQDKTFAIFNYQDINWTTHTEAGGDISNGEGGIAAYVGFNGGKGTRAFEYYPYSQKSTIRNLVKTGCSDGLTGRHIFKIDSKKIVPSTCTNNMDYICKIYNDQDKKKF